MTSRRVAIGVNTPRFNHVRPTREGRTPRPDRTTVTRRWGTGRVPMSRDPRDPGARDRRIILTTSEGLVRERSSDAYHRRDTVVRSSITGRGVPMSLCLDDGEDRLPVLPRWTGDPLHTLPPKGFPLVGVRRQGRRLNVRWRNSTTERVGVAFGVGVDFAFCQGSDPPVNSPFSAIRRQTRRCRTAESDVHSA